MYVLGIETSCDETGIALYHSKKGLMGNVLFSQKTHAEYAGVVPELASRDHLRKVIPLIEKLLKKTNLAPQSINGIAYTAGPGLVGALLVGAMIAQSVSFAWNIPAIGVHHLEGHILAPMLETPAPTFPFIALLISGGHTQLIQASGIGNYTLLGETLDDAAGEAFDKTARLLNLPYPGGPQLAKLAQKGDPLAFSFPTPLLKKGLDFSFSGLKTAVARKVMEIKLDELTRANIAASFERAVVETLCVKALRALEMTSLSTLVVAGGVSANTTLRTSLSCLGKQKNIAVYYPRPLFCTDNGAMIAYAGCQRLLAHQKTEILQVRPRWPLVELPPLAT